MKNRKYYNGKRSFLGLIAALLLFAASARAESWNFSVISDILAETDSYRTVLGEIRGPDPNTRPDGALSDLVLVVGDFSPVPQNYSIFQEIFKDRPTRFVPVRGNHEKKRDVKHIETVVLPALGEKVRRFEQGGLTYTFDWKNSRFIVIDQYAGFGKSLDHADVLSWLEESLTSATHADHVFVAFHEPLVPWFPDDDPLWSLLLRHAARVRAVFVGHTHIYSSRTIRGEAGAIQLINTGNAGQKSHNDGHLTVVGVRVQGDSVSYRVSQARQGSDRFRVRDQWVWHEGQRVSAGGF